MSRKASTFGSPGLLALLALAAAGLTAAFSLDAEGPARRVAGPVPAAETSLPSSFEPASFRFGGKPEEGPAEASDAPIRLTASDGTGLALVALEAEAVLEPPLAFTELHLTFDNPRDEVIEGRFQIALPSGAAISRFAMKIGDSWQEGEVVERQRARQAYEDFLHRRQDPALLEQEAGNGFSARVFPIPARGRKELIVSYSHALPRKGEPYVLPLVGLAEIGRLDVRVLLGEHPAAGGAASNLGGEVHDRRVVELHKEGWTPDRDFAVGQDRVAERAGLRQGSLAVVRVAPPVDAVPQEIGGLYVLVDSSASRALGYRAQVRRVAELAAGLAAGAGPATPFAVAAFDQEAVPVYEGTAGGFGPEEARRLAGRRPLGASDLGGALGWLAGRLPKGERYPRVLLVTDGVATAGDTETRALKAAVRALGSRGVGRLDVLAVGGLRDEAALHELVTGNLPHDGQRLDGEAPLAEIARRLTLACRSGIEVAVAGAAWVWPRTLDGVQPGDEVLVYADLPAAAPLRLTLAGRAVDLEDGLADAPRPLLERAWAQAKIERLLALRDTAHAGDDDLRRALVHEVTDLSIRHRVLSPFTALLVLETEADYQRFGLDRRALADILTVGSGGIEVLARRRMAGPVDDFAAAKRERRDAPRQETLQTLEVDTPDFGEPEGALDSGAAEPEGAVAGGVVGGVAGGVAGGVPGGAPGGAVGNGTALETAASPPPPPAPREAPSLRVQADAAPLQVGQPSRPAVAPPVRGEAQDERKEQRTDPYTGRFGEVMARLAGGRVAAAREAAEAWNSQDPGDVLALLALGEAYERAAEPVLAARAYGSLIDLYPGRADLRRLAGERLERLGEAGLALAVDSYRKAVLDRPDHPSGHRLLAWALLAAGEPRAAFEALQQGLEQTYPEGRFRGVDRILREDFGLLGAAWLRAEPDRRREILAALEDHGAALAEEPSLRFVLTWETDANDVDLHVYDRRGGHAYYREPEMPSGGGLIADVTTGYGPECFAVGSPAGREAAPYRLAAHYYRRGPMGYGMGTVQVVRHDGHGRLGIEPRPFVAMADDAWIDLGTVGGAAK
jgi:tetratricopeptide (TPR) repeat protein